MSESTGIGRLTSAMILTCVVLVSCSTDSEPQSTPSTGTPSTGTPAAEPARAPETSNPVGIVAPLPGAPEGIVVGTSGIGAAGVRDPDGVTLFDATTGTVIQTIPTEGAPRHLFSAGPGGPVLVPLEGSDELMSLGFDGTVESVATGVGRQPHDAVPTTGGAIVVTNEMGGGVIFVRDGVVSSSLPPGPVQPGGVAAVGQYAAVADVQGNGVWVYDGRTEQLVADAPVGRKLTHALGLGADVAAFADTDGGAVYLERIDPEITELSRIEAPGNPYGLAFDAARSRLYITLTASNVLRVVDVSNPMQPAILGDLPTVPQPNSVAVDPRNGNALVTGSNPGDESSVQIIDESLLPR